MVSAMEYKYFTCGSMDEKEGLTVAKVGFDEKGEFAAGYPLKALYKKKEITKEQYEEYLRRLEDPDEPKGSPAGGLLSEKGVAALAKWREEEQKINRPYLIQQNEQKIAFVTKKIKKLLQLGVLEESDVDDEIFVNNMVEFKDEIKRRLAEK